MMGFSAWSGCSPGERWPLLSRAHQAAVGKEHPGLHIL